MEEHRGVISAWGLIRQVGEHEQMGTGLISIKKKVRNRKGKERERQEGNFNEGQEWQDEKD